MKKIAIIKDVQAILDSLNMVFRDSFNLQLYNSAEAYMSDPSLQPDLFIIDYQLSGKTGTDVCRYIKNRDDTGSIPVIMISANPAANSLAQHAGADGFLDKPFTLHSLRNIVKLYT